MERFRWQHIQFTDDSNPYICTTEKEFKRIQKKYELKEIKKGFWLVRVNNNNFVEV